MRKYKPSNRISIRKIPHRNTIGNEDKGKILGETTEKDTLFQRTKVELTVGFSEDKE